MAEATINISYQMSDETFLNTIDAAGCGIAYWADRAMVRHGAYVITANDGEGDLRKEYTLMPEDYSRAVCLVLSSDNFPRYLKKVCMELVIDEGNADIDSSIADVLTQIACFGEIIYG